MAQRRTGLTKIRNLAFTLCRVIPAFMPIVKKVYPDSIALHTAMEAVNVACAVLVEEADANLEVGD